ncbi:DMT family transporter [Gordonibacter sp. Marseille-P4307]|uniref:DMT family transporter n=1 Tax=Gordonibacter sp. Marseille-P4307 TaxID=2161815 RepID=UPI0013DE1531|nr:DMT family transporter [Gordonibacter sp. Marseille-P4307]
MEAAGSNKALGVACILAGALCWAFSGTCVQYLTQEHGMDPHLVVCVRLVLSAAILMAVCLVTMRDQLKSILTNRNAVIDLVLYGVFGCFGCQFTYIMSIAINTAGIATLMEQLGSVVVIGYACLMERRLPRKRELTAIVLGTVGMTLICTQGDLSGLALSPQGLFWGVLSMVTLAAYVLLPTYLMKKWNGVAVTAPSIMVGAVAALIFLHPVGSIVPADMGAIAGILGSVLLGVVLPYPLFLRGLREAGPVVAGLLTGIEPVAALVFTTLLLGTAVTGFDAAGAFFIVVMLAVVALPDRPRRLMRGPSFGSSSPDDGVLDERPPLC